MGSADSNPLPDDPIARSPLSRGAGTVLLDLRETTPSVQQELVLGVVDTMLRLDLWEDVVLVADYELTALAYQLDLRHETRGRFVYYSERRMDGAWACHIRRRN